MTSGNLYQQLNRWNVERKAVTYWMANKMKNVIVFFSISHSKAFEWCWFMVVRWVGSFIQTLVCLFSTFVHFRSYLKCCHVEFIQPPYHSFVSHRHQIENGTNPPLIRFVSIRFLVKRDVKRGMHFSRIQIIQNIRNKMRNLYILHVDQRTMLFF